MKRKLSAGHGPATSQPALPQSARRARSPRQIAACPFCAWQDRRIVVDTAAMLAAHAGHPNGLHILLHEHPDQRLLLFGDDGRSQPCPHLVLTWGTCTWCATNTPTVTPQAAEFDFEHEALTRSSHDLECFLKEKIVPRGCSRRFMPPTPVCCRKVNTKWAEAAVEGNPAMAFHLDMSIYFAVDPGGLFKEAAGEARGLPGPRCDGQRGREPSLTTYSRRPRRWRTQHRRRPPPRRPLEQTFTNRRRPVPPGERHNSKRGTVPSWPWAKPLRKPTPAQTENNMMKIEDLPNRRLA